MIIGILRIPTTFDKNSFLLYGVDYGRKNIAQSLINFWISSLSAMHTVFPSYINPLVHLVGEIINF